MRWRARVIAAGVFVLALGGGLAAPASAAEPPPADGSDAIALSWTGDGFASQLVGPLYPHPVTVPGDSGDRSFFVRNDGPSAGELTVEIVDVELLRDPTDPFYADFLLADRPAIELYGHDTLIDTHTMARGEVVQVSVPFEFPVDVTTGNTRDGEVRVEFDVRLTLRGDTPSQPGGEIPSTGFDGGLIAVIAGVVIAIGTLLVGARALRRRPGSTRRTRRDRPTGGR